MDVFTFFILLVNFSALAVTSVFGISTVLLARGCLLLAGAFAAWFFAHLPEWTTWAILLALVIFDLIAVLAPKGPLRVLVETAQERNEPIPAPIYEGDGLKLGLGDFVFYSVLVARASFSGYAAMIACILAVFAGLGCTLVILATTRKTLPALPISILFGAIAYFLTQWTVSPFLFHGWLIPNHP
jgi:presenilin 1